MVPTLVAPNAPRGSLPTPPAEFAEGTTSNSPAYGPARPGVLRSNPSVTPPRPGAAIPPPHLPSMFDLAHLARSLAAETSLVRAAASLQRAAKLLLRVTDATCVWIDWPRRTATSITGRSSPQVEELVLDVAGSGRSKALGSTIIQPIGRAPARAVLALRKTSGMTFASDELMVISTIAAGIAPALDRLIASDRP